MLESLEGIRVEQSFKLGLQTSNNEAEYEALVAGLRVVVKVGNEHRSVFGFMCGGESCQGGV